MNGRGTAGLLVVLLVVSACSSSTAAGVLEISSGDSAAFCSRWFEARAALQADFESSEEWELRSDVERVRRVLDEVGALVPPEVRADWESAIGYQSTVIKLLGIADYVPERLPIALIDAAFGEGGFEEAETVAVAASQRVDMWALEQCGSFCELWPRLDKALGWGGGDTSLGGIPEWHIINQGPEDEALILLVDRLVPDAVRGDWDAAATMKLSTIDLYRSWGWEPAWGRLSNEAIARAWSDAFGFTDESLERFFQEVGDVQMPEGDPLWYAAATVSGRHREAISDWSHDNCEYLGTSGLPGVVRVEGPKGGPAKLLIAALPRDTDLDDIEDSADFLAVACSEDHWIWEAWSTPLLAKNGDFHQPCTALHLEHVAVSEALFPAGDYDLFVGTFPAGFGSFDVYVPAPELCAVAPFTVDGDTEIALPDLAPCDLGALAGTPEEIARRNPPPGPTEATGTLRVVLTEYFPDGTEWGEYRIVVLDAGVTLNDIGRGDAWPVASACLHYRPLDEGVDPAARAVIDAQGVLVPLQAFPAIPNEAFCADALLYAGFEDDRLIPDPIGLAVGDYDVYIVVEWGMGDGGNEHMQCADLTVSVAGDITVEAPPMGECP